MRIATILLFVIAACSADPIHILEDAGASDATSMDAGVIDAGVIDAGTIDAGAPTSCHAAGGVCAGTAPDCTDFGGTWLKAFDRECDFSDGPGFCCVPPAPKPSGDTCADFGGVCTPVGGCLREEVKGHFAPPACSPVPMVCCVPDGSCPEPRPVCCDATATYRATCSRGTYVCPSGSMRLEVSGRCE